MPAVPTERGRRFACTHCGACCLQDGLVFFRESELKRMAAFLGLEEQAFRRRYHVRRDPDGPGWLVEAKAGKGCPLLTSEGFCSVHEVKPSQCSAFPFWPELLASTTAWAEAKGYCPGIDAPGSRLYRIGEIRSISDEVSGTDELEKPFAGHRTDV